MYFTYKNKDMKQPFPFVAILATCLLWLDFSWAEKSFTEKELELPGKRGVCMTMISQSRKKVPACEKRLETIAKLSPYWNYSWSPVQADDQEKYFQSEFVPMIYNARKGKEALGKVLEDEVIPHIKTGRVKRILGFNEPCREKQGNMSVEESLKAWPQLEALGIPLCSPSPTHAEKEWMKEFMAGLKKSGGRVDYIGVHSYGGTNAKSFMNKMKNIYKLYNKPILITEFSPADWDTKGQIKNHKHTPAKVLAFAKKVIPWMEEQDWIVGYAWFSFKIRQSTGYTSALVDADDNLTALGRYYASVTTENPSGDQSIKPDDPTKLFSKATAAAIAYEEAKSAKISK